MNIYLVGGAVRDTLLKLKIKDRDWVVVGSTKEEMLGKGFIQVGKDFPVFLHPDTKEEYALARKERKISEGHTGFECQFDSTVTLEEDLSRRDFTVNAIAMNDSGEYIDPYNGIEDIKNKIFRHVTDAFVEDPLRVLRLARFCSYYPDFIIASETKKLAKEIVLSGELEAISSERIFKELEKALLGPAPHIFFKVLLEVGALRVLFPELFALHGVPQVEDQQSEVDSFDHVMLSLQQGSLLNADVQTMYTILCLNLGRGLTPEEILPHHLGHEAAGDKQVRSMARKLRPPLSFVTTAMLASKYQRIISTIDELEPKVIVKTLTYLDAYRREERFRKILLACEASQRSRLGFENKPYHAKSKWLGYLEITKTVNVQELIQKGFEGENLKIAIYEQRIRLIKNSYSD